MDTITAIELFIGLMLFIAAVGAVAGILSIIRKDTTNALLQKAIDLVMPYVTKGIHAADVMAINTLTNVETTLDGEDKKKIADSFYDLIPTDLHIGRLPVPVKSLVPREMFEKLVEDAYQEFDVLLSANIAFLSKNLPVIPTPAKTIGTSGYVATNQNEAIVFTSPEGSA